MRNVLALPSKSKGWAGERTNTFQREAMKYYDAGMLTVPYRIDRSDGASKILPMVQWGPFKLKRPERDVVRGWFDDPRAVGIALVLGSVSNSVYVRDFDSEESYQEWKKAFPEAAQTLPTAKSRKGYHVYFRTLEKVEHRAWSNEGELRSVGHLCNLPPSLHKQEDFKYQWIIKPPSAGLSSIIECKLSDTGLQLSYVTQTLLRRAVTGLPSSVPVYGRITSGSLTNAAKIVAEALPTDFGQTDSITLPRLCRAILTAERDIGEKFSRDDIQRIFKLWYQKASATGFLRHSERHYQKEFYSKRKYIRSPLGATSVRGAYQKAVLEPLPMVATDLFSDPETQRAVALCRQMQRDAGEHPFFLGCRDLTEVLGYDRETNAMKGSRILDSLLEAGVLKLERESVKRLAREYRYQYPLTDVQEKEKSRLRCDYWREIALK